jgi:lipopolysaccharide export system protein LptA
LVTAKAYFWAVKKIGLILFVFLFPLCLLAQQTITVVSNIKVTYDKERGSYRWYRPVFAHEGSTLAADSADFNEGDNFFDAYGHVVITQPNGTVVYADKLHYTESTRQALLTGNVRLVDRGATLTTNYLTYNMKSRIGTYHGGGTIINGRDTLNSKNGYYFENSQDAYFRHDVVVRTPDVVIKTDTMRYNSNSKMTYFYGPTNIVGENGTLYTENGDYNTETDRARFGKNNLYTEGSKFLRGDSLYYDGVSGNGRAVKNVVFIDTAQKILMRGQLGTHHKASQSTVVTQNAYIVLATKDSTARDSLPADSAGVPRDSTETRMDSTYMTADTLFSQVIPLRDYQYAQFKLGSETDELEDEEEEVPDMPAQTTITRGQPADSLRVPGAATDSLDATAHPVVPDSLKIPDSLRTPDSLAADSVPPGKKELRRLERAKKREAKRLEKEAKQRKKEEDRKLEDLERKLGEEKELQDEKAADSAGRATGIPVGPDSLARDSLTAVPPLLTDSAMSTADSLVKAATHAAMQAKTDSVSNIEGETRVVKAYRNVRIFKSNLQMIADSAYYGYADSVIRTFGRPIIWSQGSQLSADTVYLILKNQKIENVLFEKNAFIVNTQLDSSHFNQVKGRKITGYFENNKLDRVYVDGNAESIYYTVEENEYTGMLRSLSSRIKIKFEDNEMTDIFSIRKPENTYYPIGKIPQGTDILEGFIWRPEFRPKSKEEIISGSPPARPAAVPPASESPAGSADPPPGASETEEQPERQESEEEEPVAKPAENQAASVPR